jgi:hypothetical protein
LRFGNSLWKNEFLLAFTSKTRNLLGIVLGI